MVLHVLATSNTALGTHVSVQAKQDAASVPLEGGLDSIMMKPEAAQLQLERLREEHSAVLARKQAQAEQLRKAQQDIESMTGQLSSASKGLDEVQQQRDILQTEQHDLSRQLQASRTLIESYESARLLQQQDEQRHSGAVAELQAELAAVHGTVDTLQQQLDAFATERDSALSEASVARELLKSQEAAVVQLEKQHAQVKQQLEEVQRAHLHLEAQAATNMDKAESDRSLALSLAEQRLQELQALQAHLESASEASAAVPGLCAEAAQPATADAATSNGAEVTQAEAAESVQADGTASPEQAMQSNPLFSPAPETSAEGTPLREAPAAVPVRKPGAAMRKVKELQAALNRKDIELVALQAQLQTALQHGKAQVCCLLHFSMYAMHSAPRSICILQTQRRACTIDGLVTIWAAAALLECLHGTILMRCICHTQDRTVSTAEASPQELQALQELKMSTEAECSRLQGELSELRSSLETADGQRQSAQDELQSARARLSAQSAETEEASRRVAVLTAELESACEQAQRLQSALDAANEKAEAGQAELESAHSQSKEAAQKAQASAASAEELRRQLTEVQV